MFNKILIANRGEIAVRIIHACREMNIPSVAVYSEADHNAMHAQLADEAICIGPAATKDSYLNIQAILAACEITGANALHPGFGFLSENSSFAKACNMCGVTFIGPSPEAMEQIGDKINAILTMKKAGVPVVPGSHGIVKNLEEAKEIAKNIGYPVMIKAAAGGGGHGIRKVHCEQELKNAMTLASTEAFNFFGNANLYIEKYIERPRHIEFQVLADKHHHIVHLGERDCSLQRRNQKLLEETPCPILSPSLREEMANAAVKAVRACNYVNAGTVEFLLDEDHHFYFLEMNARLQVEHGITELVTGVDIVHEQIKIAAGYPLDFKQEDIAFRGHAIECRINAETPAEGFRPSPGTVEQLNIPCGNGIRVDSCLYNGFTITPYYDNMIAKVMAYAPNRADAIQKMKWALAEFFVDGVNTNIDFQLMLLRDHDYMHANYDINFLSRKGY